MERSREGETKLMSLQPYIRILRIEYVDPDSAQQNVVNWTLQLANGNRCIGPLRIGFESPSWETFGESGRKCGKRSIDPVRDRSSNVEENRQPRRLIFNLSRPFGATERSSVVGSAKCYSRMRQTNLSLSTNENPCYMNTHIEQTR